MSDDWGSLSHVSSITQLCLRWSVLASCSVVKVGVHGAGLSILSWFCLVGLVAAQACQHRSLQVFCKAVERLRTSHVNEFLLVELALSAFCDVR